MFHIIFIWEREGGFNAFALVFLSPPTTDVPSVGHICIEGVGANVGAARHQGTKQIMPTRKNSLHILRVLSISRLSCHHVFCISIFPFLFAQKKAITSAMLQTALLVVNLIFAMLMHLIKHPHE
jgi:hypothetical protein